ncbi:hypothetical protein [Devosia ginsengisoli]|uniref:VCBS repeat-containing protein n=1 Tax=Devosia ginsengisoli TaxID=400770 RepID=A0A5B8LQI6_9HYPH|nr:hypothetical protein [Devosia ginsengisoli]QDZ10508.1 hypothetical protein FPZ08_06945 [Devosia ginsengisoli]
MKISVVKVVGLSVLVVLSAFLGALGYRAWRPHQQVVAAPVPAPVVAPPDDATISIQRERDWYRYFYSYYGSMERYRQTGHVDQRSRVYADAIGEFYEIDDVSELALCPAPSDSLVTSQAIYFGARVAFLSQRSGGPIMYSMSYLGSADWIHGEEPFDAFWPVTSGSQELSAADNAGLAATVLSAHGSSAFNRGDLQYFAPISFNVADANGDGDDDFWLGGRLVLSGPDGYALDENEDLASKEVSFLDQGSATWALVANRDNIDVFDPGSIGSGPVASIPLEAPLSTTRSFTVMPVQGGTMFLAVTDGSVDVYNLSTGWAADRVASLTGFQTGELFAGAFGDFTGDDVIDFWLSESRWKNDEGEIVGRLMLIDGAAIASAGKVDVQDLARTTLLGSTRYSDYDGISATLSPKAGDLDGDGTLDLSFTGHRHMSEAGALFVLPGTALKAGAMSVTDPSIIKIVGQPVSQLAPYYNHMDLGGHIIVAADNDLCSGLNAGAIYDVTIPESPRMADR